MHPPKYTRVDAVLGDSTAAGVCVAVVVGDGPAPMNSSPSGSAGLSWRAEPGVVGKISKCESGWCLFDVAGKRGYIAVDRIWGVDPGEVVE